MEVQPDAKLNAATNTVRVYISVCGRERAENSFHIGGIGKSAARIVSEAILLSDRADKAFIFPR